MNVKFLLFICVVCSLAFFSCSDEETSGWQEKEKGSEQILLANGIDLTDFPHISEEQLSRLKQLDLNRPMTKSTDPVIVKTIDPAGVSLPGETQTVTVVFGGDWDASINLHVRVYDLKEETYIIPNAPVNMTDSTVILTISDYYSDIDMYDTRVLIFEYGYDDAGAGDTVYKFFDLKAQYPIFMKFEANYPDHKLIEYNEQTFTMRALSTYPAGTDVVTFEIVDTLGNVVVTDVSNLFISASQRSFNFTITENEGKDIRPIVITWRMNLGAWNLLDTINQKSMFASIDIAGGTVTNILPQGSAANVTLYSNDPFPVDTIQIRAKGVDVITLDTIEVKGLAYRTVGQEDEATGTLLIPDLGNNGWGEKFLTDISYFTTPTRRWFFEANRGGDDWVQIDNKTQNNFFLSVDNMMPKPATIETGGGNWNIKIKGRWNESVTNVWFRAVDLSSGTPDPVSTATSITPTQSTTVHTAFPLVIDANSTGSSRTISLQYCVKYAAPVETDWLNWVDANPQTSRWTGNKTIVQF